LLSELKGASTFSVGALSHPCPSERSHPAEKVANLGLGDPIFAEEDGSPLTPKILALMMDRTKCRLDLASERKELIGLHALRGTCASLLRKAGR